MYSSETTRYILKFSIPLIAGSILQQLYNTMDALIVGRCLGERSLAAMGAASPILSLLVFFLFGAGIGLTVLFANDYGSRDMGRFRATVDTALWAGALFTLALSAACIAGAKALLYLANTPGQLIPQALTYLRIAFAGLFFTYLYNFYSSALLALGDSKTPCFALALSSAVNIALDYLLVAVLQIGIAGAALATVLAQGLSVTLCALRAARRHPELALLLSRPRIDPRRLRDIVSFSSASALQQSILYGGRLMVQGAVNSLSVGTIAGYSAACRIESFVLAPLEGVASSSSSFCARHMGAGQPEKVKDGFFSGVFISMSFNAVISTCIFCLAPSVIPLFASNPSLDARMGGIIYLRHMAVFYIAVSFTQMLQALFRGLGWLRVTILNTVLQITLRVVLTYLLIGSMGIAAVCWGTLAGWVAMIFYGGCHMLRFFRRTHPFSHTA